MGATSDQVHTALHNAGHYRVVQAQRVAGEGDPDGISGALLLALGLRETGLRNIQGGAKLVGGRWVALGPEDSSRMDVGALQISRTYHPDALRALAAVKAGTWGPVVAGKTPMDFGFVPQWTTALRFTIDEMREAIAYAHDRKVGDPVRFAVAAHNAGIGGALSGYRAGDVDKHTAHGDYSRWVLATRGVVNSWLGKHPNWRP